MKKTIWIRLACLLLAGLLLAGCAAQESQQVKDDRQKLEAILDEIAEITNPDSAASKLSILRVTVDLVSWAGSSSLTPSQTSDTVMNWLDKHPDQKDRLTSNLQSVGESFSSILNGTAGKLLETISSIDLSNLNDGLVGLIDAIINSGK